MYRKSSDRRFQKNKKQIRRAFIDLTIQRGFRRITISDIAARADINRMTFYAHYDTVEDVFDEFVDDMEQEITAAVSREKQCDIDHFFTLLNQMMYQEIDFFRYIAKEENCAYFRSRFRCRWTLLKKRHIHPTKSRSAAAWRRSASLTPTWTGWRELTATSRWTPSLM